MRLLRTILLTSAALCSFYLLTGCQDSKKTKPAPKLINESAQPQKQVPLTKEPVQPKVNNTAATPKPKETVNAAEKKDAPKIVFEKTAHDFGVMVPNKYYNTEYKFTNAGKSELIIGRIESPCGCMVPQLKKKNYAPGESGTIKVRYHANKKAVKTVNKAIVVHSNDPVTPKVKLFIKGSIEIAVTVKPKMLKLSLREENAGAMPIVIESTTDKPFSISQIKDSAGTMSFVFDPNKKATKFSITPTVDLEKLKKRNVGLIMITAKTPDINQLNITYEAPEICEVSRKNIIIQNAEPGKAQEKDIWITSNYDDKLEIESISITSMNNYMEVINKESQGNRIKLTVRITPPVPKGKKRHFTDKLEIKIPGLCTLSVRCSGWYKRTRR
jgi:hypothetical protein